MQRRTCGWYVLVLGQFPCILTRQDLAHLTPDAQVALPGLQQSHSIGTQSSSELGLESPLTSIDTPDSGVPFFQGFVKGA